MAAGAGLRFGQTPGGPKQLALLGGRPVLARTAEALGHMPFIGEVVVVLPPDLLPEIYEKVLKPLKLGNLKAVPGGASRAQSTALGLAAVDPLADIVLVHDGVRPMVGQAQVAALIEKTQIHGAAILAVPVRDTLKKVGPGGVIEKTVDREDLWQAQTPQAFKRDLLAKAVEAAEEKGLNPTDEAGLLEALGLPVYLVEGDSKNLKITRPADLEILETLMGYGQGAPALNMRQGHGYDVHRFVPGRPLWLGCCEIDYDYGLWGHSDADVLSHALADALLGAAGLGDIGRHFPDKDERWRGLAGRDLLAMVMDMVRAKGFELVNADMTVIGERPKIAPQADRMLAALAAALGLADSACLNIKGKTTEGLGFTGREEGLAAAATVLLYRRAEG